MHTQTHLCTLANACVHTHTHARSTQRSPRLTVLLGLEGDLAALLLAFGVGQRQPHVHGPKGWQVAQGEVGGVAFDGQALAHRGVVPQADGTSAADNTADTAATGSTAATRGHGVAVAEGDAVAVAAGEVVAQGLPLQRQLPRQDLGGGQATQGPHRL